MASPSDFDRLPAYGLREDVFDDALRVASEFQREYLEEDVVETRRRGPAKNYGGEGVSNKRMCQTEVALRLARGLAESPLFRGHIDLVLGGVEVNRNENGVTFPVANYLSRWGFSRDRARQGVQPPWIGFYTHKRIGRKLLLNFDKSDAHVTAFFATGERLVVHCTAGSVGETRGPVDAHDLNRAIGRAIGALGTKPGDIIAVCTPRSSRFRKLTAARRNAEGVRRVGLRFIHVDRAGGVQGLIDDSTGS
jgi:hypothetical protein